jgi:hypothetical protein
MCDRTGLIIKGRCSASNRVACTSHWPAPGRTGTRLHRAFAYVVKRARPQSEQRPFASGGDGSATSLI